MSFTAAQPVPRRRRTAGLVLAGAVAAAIVGGGTALNAGDANAGYTQTFGPYPTASSCVSARQHNGAYINKSKCFSLGASSWYYTGQHI